MDDTRRQGHCRRLFCPVRETKLRARFFFGSYFLQKKEQKGGLAVLGVHLICVGRLKEKYYREAAAEYAKRLGHYCKLTVTELAERRLPPSPSPGEVAAALAREGEAIRQKIPAGAGVVALCVEGEQRSSPELSRLLADWSNTGGGPLALVVGGSYGLDGELKRSARLRLSMSKLTFPHHLARVMVLEQIYRAFKIQEGSAYHK